MQHVQCLHNSTLRGKIFPRYDVKYTYVQVLLWRKQNRCHYFSNASRSCTMLESGNSKNKFEHGK